MCYAVQTCQELIKGSCWLLEKNAKRQYFKGLRMDSLPVLYYANKSTWMTSETFRRWLMSWEVELRQKSRKDMLLLDNFAAHPHLDCLKNIHLEFLLPNTTSLVQPVDMGILKLLKTLYHRKLVNYILEATEENLLTSSSTAWEDGARVSLLQAVQFVADSWREISSKTIQNCFTHCFKHSSLDMPNMSNIENEAILELQRIRKYEGFVCFENSIQCCNENGECEDAIVEEIAAKQQETSEDQGSDEVDTPE
jgi:hypothetical protein